MREKYKLIAKRLELSRGEIQSYYLDENPKANIAEYRKKEKKICVNKKFEELPKKEKIAILYHERGHSNFYLWRFFHEIGQFFYSFSLIFSGFSILLILVNLITNDLIFEIPNLIWIIMFISGLFFFIGFVSINYLLESIADIYSVLKTKDKTLIKVIKRDYDGSNKKSWRDKYILHPSPNLREKIIEKILK